MDAQYKLFFGGAFSFDCRDEDYDLTAAEDYRAQLLGSVQALVKPKDMSGVLINDNVLYIGPFYFEAESRKAEKIPRNSMLFNFFFIIVSALEVNLCTYVENTGHGVAHAEVESRTGSLGVVAVEP